MKELCAKSNVEISFLQQKSKLDRVQSGDQATRLFY